MDKRTNRRGGFYWEGNIPYLSVTEVLKIIDKPALRYWFGKEVYHAVLKEPNLNEKDALSAPYKTSKKAKSRGTTVHSIVEAYKKTGEIEVSPEFSGYADAFYSFMRMYDLDILDQERTLFSKEHKIAGTTDLYGKIKKHHILIDVKTGKDVYTEAGLQLSAYAQMLREEGKPIDEIAVLLLETGQDGLPTGNFKFQTMTDDFGVFLSAKSLYCYLNYEKLLKVGYFV